MYNLDSLIKMDIRFATKCCDKNLGVGWRALEVFFVEKLRSGASFESMEVTFCQWGHIGSSIYQM